MYETNFHVNEEVVFTALDMHESMPHYYPPVGTVGVVKHVLKQLEEGLDTRIQWPSGTTSETDLWWVNHSWIELAHPDQGEVEKSDLPISFLLDAGVDV